ncbi:MAG: hypothetical protein EXR70_23690 [Deltaproteobacteria bacterium]|nr:hypothetical protein [Deltaproteobacteria bacterium]
MTLSTSWPIEPQPESWTARRRNSIRYRLAAWGVGLLAGALAITTFIGSSYTRSQIQRSAAELQSEVASTTARRVESFIIRKLERLEDIGTAMSLNPLGSAGQRMLGLLLLKNDPAFSEVAVLDGAGMEVLKFADSRVFSTADLKSRRQELEFTEAARGRTTLERSLLRPRRNPFSP